MRQGDVRFLPGYEQPKSNVITAAAIFAALTAPISIIFAQGTWQNFVAELIFILGFSLLILRWCYLDRLERGHPLGSGFRVLIVFFGVIALFIYLIKSRGLKHGLRSVGEAFLVCVAIILIMFFSEGIFDRVFESLR